MNSQPIVDPSTLFKLLEEVLGTQDEKTWEKGSFKFLIQPIGSVIVLTIEKVQPNEEETDICDRFPIDPNGISNDYEGGLRIVPNFPYNTPIGSNGNAAKLLVETCEKRVTALYHFLKDLLPAD